MVERASPEAFAAAMMPWIPFIESGSKVAGFFMRGVMSSLTRQVADM
jgi:hypothetical protein